MEYSTDLFDAARMDRMLAHYRILLDEIVVHPGPNPIGAFTHACRGRANASARGMECRPSIDHFARVLDGPANDDLDFFLYDLSPTELATDE